MDEAADLYRAYASRLLIDGLAAEQRALTGARRAAQRARRLAEYEAARRAAVTAWRAALPAEQGPWLLVGRAIANAAGAMVLADVLDERDYRNLAGPWRQALGMLIPVGPGQALIGASGKPVSSASRTGTPKPPLSRRTDPTV